jgi:hypothetical protein
VTPDEQRNAQCLAEDDIAVDQQGVGDRLWGDHHDDAVDIGGQSPGSTAKVTAFDEIGARPDRIDPARGGVGGPVHPVATDRTGRAPTAGVAAMQRAGRVGHEAVIAAAHDHAAAGLIHGVGVSVGEWLW